MAKSSIEYTELAGLRIALSNLQLTDITNQDEDFLAVVEWLQKRIKRLENK